MRERTKEPRVGDTIRWADEEGPQSGMVVAITRAPVISHWDGSRFVLTPSPDEYLVEIACADCVRLVGRATLRTLPPPPKPAE